MHTLPIDANSRLADHSMFRVSESLAQSIEVLNGAIWITQPREPRDIVVTAGQSVTLDHPVAAIVSAIGGPACVKASTLAAVPSDYAAAA